MTNSTKLEGGTIFGGTYKIIDFIGEGGMGHVYKVEHLLMQKLLALKILKSEYLTEAVWKRFRAEGQAIARLNHANIVRIYDMSQTEDAISALGKLAHLEKLNLSNTRFNQSTLAESAALANLSKLDIAGARSIAYLKALQKSQKLLRLVLAQ
jgi:serine/threonine protein kinase